ncbi:hypothetical protein ACJWDR_28930 [Streptomyces tauricus]|uniref:hypothetical protein n=1 Tax=Streptomyces tauricus TaxID=68274 RepID=UPI00387F17C8
MLKSFKRSHIIIAALALAAGLSVTVWLLVRTTYDEHVTNCEKALTKSATEKNRPDACEELSQNDYDTLRVGWALENALDGMSKKERDTLDYYDNGTIDGSIG